MEGGKYTTSTITAVSELAVRMNKLRGNQRSLQAFLFNLYYIQIPLRSPHASHHQKSSPLPPPKRKKNQLLHQKPYLLKPNSLLFLKRLNY